MVHENLCYYMYVCPLVESLFTKNVNVVCALLNKVMMMADGDFSLRVIAVQS